MGRLLGATDGEQTPVLSVYPERENSRVDFSQQTAVFFHKAEDDDIIQVRLPRRGRLPTRGWIRLENDTGDASQIRRQRQATETLRSMRLLLEQLHDPRAVRGLPNRWRHVAKDLKGRGPEITREMLVSEPFYALHGPPGTGKTTVASIAITAALRDNPGLRVLVTSQSHHALDNLGQHIMSQCAEQRVEPVAIRIASERARAHDKVTLDTLRPEAQASARARAIQRSMKRALERDKLADGRPLTPALRTLVGQWRDQARRIEPEIRDRLRRGANLVFATTGACTEDQVGTGDVGGLYDWVIVEEAARAWPTELAMPLVRGRRWTLIGDHLQLPAFDEMTVQKVLDLCQDSDDEGLRVHGERIKTYLQVYRLFATLFARRAKRLANAKLVEPLAELDLQFRMHPDIAALVSRAFYRTRIDPNTGEETTHNEGWLRTPTHEDFRKKHLHHLTAPAFLRQRALVWIDTEGWEDADDQRAWKNTGEVHLVSTLLHAMRPVPQSPDNEDFFALLTPYTLQKKALEASELPPWAQGRVHTVDSFQGREADIVVVSMVRSVHRADRPEANIGYLISPNRINVLLSRARKLLVIVGRFSHFEAQATEHPEREDLAFWGHIAAELRRQQAVVPATVLKQHQKRRR